MNVKKLVAITCMLTIGITTLTGCSGTSSKDKTYKIGVIQYVQHSALDDANKGFFKAFDDAGIKYDADQQNAAGEPSTAQTIADTLSNGNKDLIFAIATPAAQAIAGTNTDAPIVFTAVTDPAAAKLVESNEAPGGNITGTSDLSPIKEQIDLLCQLLPEAKKVGILYCTAEANSVLQAEIAKEACKNKGLTSTDFTVSGSNEIQTVVESMVGKVDAIYVPTDNMISSGMATVSMIANENKLPIICGEEGMLLRGALATYGINYEALGYKAGEMAISILKEGKNPATTPVEYLELEQCRLAINETAAKTLGIDLSQLENATIINTAE